MIDVTLFTSSAGSWHRPAKKAAIWQISIPPDRFGHGFPCQNTLFPCGAIDFELLSAEKQRIHPIQDPNSQTVYIVLTGDRLALGCGRSAPGPRSASWYGRPIPIGEFRDRAYRVRRDLLKAWGELTVRDGYIQRSARPPRFLDPQKFLNWFRDLRVTLLEENNPRHYDVPVVIVELLPAIVWKKEMS